MLCNKVVIQTYVIPHHSLTEMKVNCEWSCLLAYHGFQAFDLVCVDFCVCVGGVGGGGMGWGLGGGVFLCVCACVSGNRRSISCNIPIHLKSTQRFRE